MIDGGPFVQAMLDALTAGLPGSYFVGDAQGAPVPANAVPAVVLYASAGLVGGYPFAPGRDLTGSVALHGIGVTRTQAQNAAKAGRDILLAGVSVGGVVMVITPDDAPTPLPQRDDSLTPPVFVQPLVFDFRIP